MSKKFKFLISFISVFLVFSVIACSVFVIVDRKKHIETNGGNVSENTITENTSEYEDLSSESSSEREEETTSSEKDTSESEESSSQSSLTEEDESSSAAESESPPPHKHSYSAVQTTAPTCTADGFTVYKCSCGDSYRGDNIPAKGHSWGAWETTKAATITSQGEETRSCSNCSEKEMRKTEKLPPPIQADSYQYIMGKSVCTAEQLEAYVKRWNPNGYKLTCSLYDLATYYIEEGEAEGVRGDIAFCQAIWETGWFRYGGDVSYKQNNFCGLGTVGGGVGGASFEKARIGVRAHIQHLKAYASTEALKNTCVDPRFGYVSRGSATTWIGLSGKWAYPGYDESKYESLEAAIAAEDTYGHKILSKYKQMAGIS